MNILYLNHYAGSPALGMEYRPYYLAREWVRAGHRVQTVAATFSHVRTRQPAAGDETLEGIDHHWVPAPPYRGNGWGRVRNIASFLARVWREAPRLVQARRPDVVIASSTYPMDIWVARRLARLAGAKLVYEVHDLWPLSPMELFDMPRWHPFIALCQLADSTVGQPRLQFPADQGRSPATPQRRIHPDQQVLHIPPVSAGRRRHALLTCPGRDQREPFIHLRDLTRCQTRSRRPGWPLVRWLGASGLDTLQQVGAVPLYRPRRQTANAL